jgi:hypothetical protein
LSYLHHRLRGVGAGGGLHSPHISGALTHLYLILSFLIFTTGCGALVPVVFCTLRISLVHSPTYILSYLVLSCLIFTTGCGALVPVVFCTLRISLVRSPTRLSNTRFFQTLPLSGLQNSLPIKLQQPNAIQNGIQKQLATG